MNWTDGYRTLTTGQLIESHIESAPDYHAGELERLKTQVYEMQLVVQAIADLLTPKQQERLIAALPIYGFVKDPS